MDFKTIATTLAGVALISAFADQSASAIGKTATAELKFADGKDAGTVTLTEAASGVLLKYDFKGLAPGPHGLHVHEVGKCEGDFSTAGGIYNPLGASHGFLNEEGPMAGDLPNVIAASDGTAVAEVLSPYLNLSQDGDDGLFDGDGSALVLYEKADNYLSDPEGGAEPRIACGVLKAQ